MSQDVLFVPICLEAMVIGENPGIFADMSLRFNFLKDPPYVGDSVMNTPFAEKKAQPAGVHLHWKMPDALMHGEQGEDGQLVFPALPNRWILQRFRADGKRIDRKAWMIESDRLLGKAQGSVSIPLFDLEDGIWKGGGEDGSVYAYLGHSSEYGTEQAEEGQYLKSLTAIGSGDPLFASFYPYCQSVFGFYDSLDQEPEGLYSYLITGYYSDKLADPLHQASAEVLEQLDWFAKDAKNPTNFQAPTTTCCHGLVQDVEWEGKDIQYRDGIPKGQVDAYIGNTSMEALSLLINEKKPGMERIFTALQYNYLSVLDDASNADAPVDLEYLLHGKQFSSEGARSKWSIKPIDEEDPEKPRLSLSEGEAAAFTQLENLQEEIDSTLEQIESLKETIYYAWWKYLCNKENPWANEQNFRSARKLFVDIQWDQLDQLSSEESLEHIEKLCGRIEGLKEQVSNLTLKINSLVGQINEDIKDKNGRVVKENGSRYYEPNPPALLLSGGMLKPTWNPGNQGDENHRLPCRLRPITGVPVDMGNRTVYLDERDIAKLCSPTQAPLPPFAEQLAAESIALSGSFKAILQYAAQSKKEPGTPDANALEPFKLANVQWRQPWTPILMHWSVELEHTRTCLEKDDSFSAFHLEDIDFALNDKFDFAGIEKVSLVGSTMISPHATVNLADMIQQYISDYGKEGKYYEDLVEAAQTIEGMEVLSQRLDGFNQTLLMQNNVPYVNVYDDDTDKGLLKRITQALGINRYYRSPRTGTAMSFFPARGAGLRLKKLWIVDAFGRAKEIEVDEAKTHIAETLFFEGGRGLLRPRFLQPCAIQTDWLYHQDDALLATDKDISPVFGYIVPSFLDGSLQIHDQQGMLLGHLLSASGQTVFEPAMGPDFSVQGFQSEHLRLFVQGLIDSETGLSELMECLEISLQSTVSGGSDSFLQSCFGKVIALARAKVNVYGKGLTPCVQDWSTESNSAKVDEAPFQILLGDNRRLHDGLIGFFKEKDYQNFYAEAEYGAQKYVRQDSSISLSLKSEPQALTVMMVPDGYISLRTGLLPEHKMNLNAEYYQDAIENMECSFRTAPVISREDPFFIPIPGNMKSEEWEFQHLDIQRNHNGKSLAPEPETYLLPQYGKIFEGSLITKRRSKDE